MGVEGARVYRIEAFGYLFAGVVVLLTVIGVVVLLPRALRDPSGELPLMLLWFAILGWFWFNILSSPYEVRVEPDGRLIFRSLRRRVEVHASQTQSVRGMPLGGGAVITYDGGKIWLRANLAHFFDFIQRLRALNPGLETKRV
jgi:hypothetical protein